MNLFSWMFLILCLGFFARAEAHSNKDGCAIQVKNYTGIDPTDTFVISSANELTRERAKAYSFVRYNRDTYLGESCRTETDRILGRLQAYLPKRFLKLLSEGGVDSMWAEWKLLIFSTRQEERETLEKDFPTVAQAYLLAVKEDLLLKLATLSPWASWVGTEFNLESWSPEWSVIMGEEAPGAVEFKTKSIALRPSLYTPAELTMFLFHEISHLNDPHFHLQEDGSALLEDRFQNEVFAWEQTLQFIETVLSHDTQSSLLIQSIRARLKEWGTEEWVRSIGMIH